MPVFPGSESSAPEAITFDGKVYVFGTDSEKAVVCMQVFDPASGCFGITLRCLSSTCGELYDNSLTSI
jgi:hypothetical protein